MKYLILICLVINSFTASSQSLSDTLLNKKYIQATLYLKTNKKINKKIKKVFKDFVKLKKKETYIPFNISSKVEYFSILDYGCITKQLLNGKYNIDSLHYTMKRIDYHKIYKFKAYKNDLISLIIADHNKKSNLYLTFSEVIDNFLVAELIYVDNVEYHNNFVRTRFGPGLFLLFIFNSQGLIENVLYCNI